MASVEEKLDKLRQERIAREKARIEKLRELNLKKYNKNEAYSINHSVSNVSIANKSISSKTSNTSTKNNVGNSVKNNFHVNGTTKRPISAPLNKSTTNKVTSSSIKPGETSNSKPNNFKNDTNSKAFDKSTEGKQVHKFDKTVPKATKKEEQKIDLYRNVNTNSRTGKTNNNQGKAICKSFAPATSKPGITSKSFSTLTKPNDSKKSIQPPKATQSASKVNPERVSVFERLYKPKIVNKVTINEAEKLHTDPSYLRKIIKDSHLIMKQRHSVAHTRPLQKTAHPVRRSISAVHFKKVSKSELSNCIHKWASIGEKIDKVDMNEIDEDECVQCEKVVSAVKSERKRVKFQTPVSLNYNTPRPEEMQARLQKWLQKRGKSLDSYHHLQCFGIFHLSKDIKSLEAPKFELYDEENKENIAVESDSDNQSYTDNLNDQKDDFVSENKTEMSNVKWRRASYISDSASFNESKNTTLTSAEDLQHFDELLLGALNDLTELLREGFDWEQCARWLRAIRDRFPSAPESAAYWECRAALEERRGDLPASMQCLGEAIAMGTERSVVESSLDQLLDKFMQLKISPNSGRQKSVDPKMVDVKNVFKSTIIRFAVQQAKLRQSNHYEPPKYTVTPVRRSGRLSVHGSAKRTPLQVCSSVSQATSLGHPVVFVPNDQLFGTP
ncbi:unnamed protein product [Parnassius mnemosyne]|uniref:Uncharacterized protein n=1 Tax=Parnassius mnemosyne TaxID=213953 RepID=A0AAV1LEU8_9NEOP